MTKDVYIAPAPQGDMPDDSEARFNFLDDESLSPFKRLKQLAITVGQCEAEGIDIPLRAWEEYDRLLIELAHDERAQAWLRAYVGDQLMASDQ